MEDSAWGKTKYDYYYTDYVDKDYPSKLSAKEENAATIEEEEGRRIQKQILSLLDDYKPIVGYKDSHDYDIIEYIKQTNLSVEAKFNKERKSVKFELSSADETEEEQDDETDGDEDEQNDKEEAQNSQQRRPINSAIQKNRGLTPYKKKEFRNPRVKHKMKYKRAMSKRRRIVLEARPEYHRYSGETTGIKTSTVKSIRLC